MASPAQILNKYLFPGTMLMGRYRLESMLGGGAYGVIYSALDTINHEIVAIKALPPANESASRTAFDRFQREMKVIESLVHPNIVSMYDYGQTEHGIPFMVLEYLEGRTLEDTVMDNPMGLEDGVAVIRQIASALAQAHAKGVIHRDLKPANVMLIGAVNPQVKVLDFGMAKVLGKLADETVAQLTREGVAVGTPRYIAPEQARGLPVGPYTDLYAVGLLMYEVFTGQRAVKANTIEDAVMAHVSRQPLPLPEISMVPPEVLPILHKLLEKDQKRRYQDARVVAQSLEQLERQQRYQAQHQAAAPAFSLHEPVDSAEITIPISRLQLDEASRAASRQPPGGARPAPHAAPRGPGHPPQHMRPALGPKIPTPKAPALELDYDKVEQFEQQRQLRVDQKEASWLNRTLTGLRAVRKPSSSFQYFELAVAPVLAVAAFAFFTSQFPAQGGALRTMIGVVPLILGLVFASLVGPMHTSLTRARCFNAIALAIILLAHVWDPATLKTQMFREPAWFLESYKETAGLGGLYDLITAMARFYIKSISSWLG